MSSKVDLARAGTMQVTAKEGHVFLDKSLTEWKKPYLTEHFDEEKESGTSSGKTKLAKHTTMKGTAKEAEAYLGEKGKPDADALTRSQQKKLDEISSETPPTKKTKLSKAGTMAVTTKEGKALLSGEKLSDTRQDTKLKRKNAARKSNSIQKTMADAKAFCGNIDAGSGRELRKRPEPKKPSLKKAGTMVNTAKEGKAFLKRSKKTAKNGSD